MKLKQILRELFDSKPMPFKYEGEKSSAMGSTRYIYSFTSKKSGLKYDAEIFERDDPDNNVREGIVEYSVDGHFDTITNANEIPSILSTMAKIVEDHYENRGGRDRVRVYAYSGWEKDIDQRDSHSITSANSRQRVYNAFLEKTLPTGWTVKKDSVDTLIYPSDK